MTRKKLADTLRKASRVKSPLPLAVRKVAVQAADWIDPPNPPDAEIYRQMQGTPVVGRIYRHTKRGILVKVLSVGGWDCVFDCPSVRYVHCAEDGTPEPVTIVHHGVDEFYRPLYFHPDAWMTPNEDGTPRFHPRES